MPRKWQTESTGPFNTFLWNVPLGESGVGIIYRLPLPGAPDRERRIDCSYLSYNRRPNDRPYSRTANAQNVVPEIAVDVASFDTPADRMVERVREYLRADVLLVYAVYPLAREIHACRQSANTVRVYTVANDLDAGDILPGFRTAVAPPFPPVEPA